MTNNSDFLDIVSLFEAVNPTAATLLSLLPPTSCQITYTAADEENFLDTSLTPPTFIHKPGKAIEEASEWAASYQLDKVDLLVVYGIGLGFYYEAIRPWLQGDTKRRVIFVEDNLEAIGVFLRGQRAKSFFADPQATLFFIQSGDLASEVIDTIAWNTYLRPWSILASPAYATHKNDSFAELAQRLAITQRQVTDILCEFFSPGDSPLQNFGRNLFLWPRSQNGASFFQKFSGIPAIVVGAGPSLDTQIPLLQKLSTKALIIAGGSAIPALLQAGIIPNFAATVDPNATQYIRMRQAQPFCLPLFYRSRALHECLLFHQGPLLYLKGGDGYPLVDYFENDLSIPGEIIEGGHSVSNMIIELAYALGCETIILSGYDLSYPENTAYTESLSEALAPDETAKQKTEETQLFHAKTVPGTMVLTEEKWITEAAWIAKFIKTFPEIKLIQTSPQGLYIEGAEHISLEKAISTYCQRTIDIPSLLHITQQEAPMLPVSHESIAASMKSISQSVEHCLKILHEMAKYLRSKETLESQPWIQLEEDLHAQIAYQAIFSVYEAIHGKLMQQRALIECRPYNDPKAEASFEKEIMISKINLFLDMAYSYRKFFSAIVSWACMNGYNLPDALHIAQYAENATLPRKFFSL